MIHVIALMTATLDQRATFFAEYRPIVPDVHANHSGIAGSPAVDADTDTSNLQRLGDDRAVVSGQWQAVAALKRLATAPRRLACRKHIDARGSDPQIAVLDTVGAV